MKLSISNIAWSEHDNMEVFSYLRKNGFTGIEVAPTKICSEWKDITIKKTKSYKRFLADEGFSIPAIQAILFNKQELEIFNPRKLDALRDHFKQVADIAYNLGAKTIVFGAPKNRRRHHLSIDEALNQGQEVFYELSEICKERECIIGIENNPIEYNCDFLSNIADIVQFTDKLNHESCKLHLDSAGVFMNSKIVDGEVIIESINHDIAHYHISEPMLEPITGGLVPHKRYIDAVTRQGYNKWLSVEMKTPKNIELLKKSIVEVKNLF